MSLRLPVSSVLFHWYERAWQERHIRGGVFVDTRRHATDINNAKSYVPIFDAHDPGQQRRTASAMQVFFVGSAGKKKMSLKLFGRRRSLIRFWPPVVSWPIAARLRE